MKKLIITALLVVSFTTFAQGKKGHKGDREKLTTEQKVDLQVKKMTSELALNETQVKEIRTLIEKEVAKRDEKKREDRKAASKEKKAEMKEEQARISAEMKTILTTEQYSKWEKMKEERKAKMNEKMQERKEKKQN